MSRPRQKIITPYNQEQFLSELFLVDQALAERSLEHYIKQAWEIVEPKNPLIWNWHLTAICEHLEAVTRGEIHYLIINIPPRHTKSLTASVFWPTWEWIDNPGARYVCSSYAQVLSTRDSLKSRRLIQSPWYQERWEDNFKITSDQNQKCLAKKTSILMSDGSFKPIYKLREGDSIFSIIDNRIVKDRVKHIWNNGKRELRRIILSDGTEIEATLNHRFYAWDNWTYVKDLKEGDALAVIRNIPEVKNGKKLDKDEVFLVSLWLAEGSKGDTSYTISTINPFIKNKLKRIADERNWVLKRIGKVTYSLVAGYNEVKNSPRRILKSYLGKIPSTREGKSKLKKQYTDKIKIPKVIFKADIESIKEFIQTYIASDGSVLYSKGKGVCIDSASKSLIKDFLLLFKRLGVYGRIERQKAGYTNTRGKYIKCKDSYRFIVKDSNELLKLRDLRIYGKEDKFKKVLRYCTTQKKQGGRSATIPPAWRQGTKGFDAPLHSWATRKRAVAFAKRKNYYSLYEKLEGDLDWRKVVKIENIGIKETWHLETINTGTFIAEGLYSHNTRFDNSKGGYRVATSVEGIGTGEGGSYILVDDPHNVNKVESDVQRENVITWWDETMSTRLDDERTGAYVIIMQRSHHNDLTGHLIEKHQGGEIRNLVTLILPARYEKERELHLQTRTPLPFKDPRIKEGQVLDKGRYPDEVLKDLESRMTEYARAGQLQQRPNPRGGGMFKVENFKIISQPPPKRFILKSVRYWDKAATEGGGSLTAGVLMHQMRKDWVGPKFIIEDVVSGQWSAGVRNERIKQTATLDGVSVYVYTEQEPGSGGKESAEGTVKDLAGFRVEADRVTGSKEIRAENYASQVEVQNVALVRGDWNREFLDQHEFFPTGSRKKDIVDASSGCFNKISFGKQKKAGVWGR